MPDLPDAPVLLLIEDQPQMRRTVRRIAERSGFTVHIAVSAEDGLPILDANYVDVALVDQGLPGMQGVQFIGRARMRHPEVTYILFTASGDVSVGFAALEKGAYDYLTKATGGERLMATLRRGVDARRLKAENQELRSQVEDSPADRLLLGHSATMSRVRDKVRQYAASRRPLLIVGESGVGKDVCARAVNAESNRRGRYVARNCGAIPRELFESQLFGHEAGAFTGADKRLIGSFEEVGEGTIFLDEIGDLPLEMQVKLLRVLENRTFRRVGGTKDLDFNGRVVAATNKDLAHEVREGRFREDLLYRLNALEIRMPPLREHPEDISMLAYMFATEEAQAIGRNITHIAKGAMDCLETYEWRQNNVRELRNTIVRMVVGASGQALTEDLLPEPIAAATSRRIHDRRQVVPTPQVQQRRSALVPQLPPDLLALPYSEAKERAEQVFGAWYVDALLRRAGGNVTEAAKEAGQRRPNFHRLMKRFGVTRPPDQALQGGRDRDD